MSQKNKKEQKKKGLGQNPNVNLKGEVNEKNDEKILPLFVPKKEK